jgi:hypothetical protein
MESKKVIYYTDQAIAQPYIQTSLALGYLVLEQGPADPEKNGGNSYQVTYQLDAAHQTVALLEKIDSKLDFFRLILVIYIILAIIAALFLR